ncbi:MAG: tetratricopeptide repeat protein [Oligoflexia bacterium]|nr:tetratricopeptide repeat protein [Oligoflexia bacterium]
MTQSKSEPLGIESNKKRPGCLKPALIALGVCLALVAAIYGGLRYQHRQAAKAQQVRATQEFAPVFQALEPQGPGLGPGSNPGPGPGYDIDQTIKVIHEIDLALAESDSMGDYLKTMSRHDYRNVAPAVLAARKDLMGVLFQIYSKQSEIEDRQQMWGLTSKLLLSTLSVVGAEGHVGTLGPTGSITVDKEQAQRLLDDLQQTQDARLKLGRDQRKLQGQLIDSLVAYSQVYHRYVDEWDRLCVIRDRAYLAAHNGDWAMAEAAADEAIAMAPDEREAHLLKALAMIEGGQSQHPESSAQVEQLLAQYIDDHPDSAAPAFLLLGVLQSKQGRKDEALLNLQQAAAYYPKQADALTDMLDPYKMRSFLRKTREGSYVIELYKNTMLGAGYFSPDLQLARNAFAAGDFEAGRAKVMDHFSRRRTQQQWDFVLSDIEFCQALLGDDFRRIFPEDHYLDLVLKPTIFGSKLHVGVDNRSDRTLHNATLVLAIQFTDMHAEDYQTFVANQTQPAVLPRQVTDYGDVEIGLDLQGTKKEVDDIVTQRAILVTDEAVLWVDTDAYKIAEAKEFRQGRKPGLARAEASARAAVVSGDKAISPVGLLDRIVADARSGTTIQIDDKKLLKDGLIITVPKELAVLRPLFRLKYGDQVFTADQNVIVDDKIQLRFDSVGDLAGDASGDGGQQIGLTVSTVLGDLEWSWGPDSGHKLRLMNVEGIGDQALGLP